MRHFLAVALAAIALAACGGGGDDGGDPNSFQQSGISYSQSGGLTWSSPSAAEYTNTTWDMGGARSYCTQKTCDTNGNNCHMSNFNGQDGWRLPALQELEARLQVTGLNTWAKGYVWSNESGLAKDFSTGQTVIAGDTVKAHVTCVK